MSRCWCLGCALCCPPAIAGTPLHSPARGRAGAGPPPAAGTEPGRGETLPVPPCYSPAEPGHTGTRCSAQSARPDPHPPVRTPAGSRARPASSARCRGSADKLRGRSLASLACLFFFFSLARLPRWPRRPEGHMAQGRRTETVSGVKRNGQTKPKREVISCGCCKTAPRSQGPRSELLPARAARPLPLRSPAESRLLPPRRLPASPWEGVREMTPDPIFFYCFEPLDQLSSVLSPKKQ